VQIFLPIAEIPVDLFVVVGLGAAVGFIGGLFGVGGGFLMTPFLIFLGVPPAVAVASGSAQIAASSTTAVLTYWRRRSIDLPLAAILTAGGVLGSLGGIALFNQLKQLGQLDLVIQLAYVTLMLTIGSLMLSEWLRALWRTRREPAQPPARAPSMIVGALPFKMHFARSNLTVSVLPLALLGVAIGFLGALMGIGGGFMTVPALIYLFRVPASIVVGTSMLQILVTMMISTMLHAVTNGSVDVLLALLLTIGGVVGAQFGARAGQNLRGGQFRVLLALLVLSVGLRFAVELVSPPEDPFSIIRSAV
jgi:uncharacterized membrane protein YfcA